MGTALAHTHKHQLNKKNVHIHNIHRIIERIAHLKKFFTTNKNRISDRIQASAKHIHTQDEYAMSTRLIISAAFQLASAESYDIVCGCRCCCLITIFIWYIFNTKLNSISIFIFVSIQFNSLLSLLLSRSHTQSFTFVHSLSHLFCSHLIEIDIFSHFI